jgi:hypothetical protein
VLPEQLHAGSDDDMGVSDGSRIPIRSRFIEI